MGEKYLVQLSWHHSVEVPSRCMFVEIDSNKNVQAQVLFAAMKDHYEYQYEVFPTVDDIVTAMRDGSCRVRVYESADDKSYSDFIVFWCDAINMGFGIGESVDETIKSENVWVNYLKWDNPDKLVAVLQGLSKDRLISLLCEEMALRLGHVDLSNLFGTLDLMAENIS